MREGGWFGRADRSGSPGWLGKGVCRRKGSQCGASAPRTAVAVCPSAVEYRAVLETLTFTRASRPRFARMLSTSEQAAGLSEPGSQKTV